MLAFKLKNPLTQGHEILSLKPESLGQPTEIFRDPSLHRFDGRTNTSTMAKTREIRLKKSNIVYPYLSNSISGISLMFVYVV